MIVTVSMDKKELEKEMRLEEYSKTDTHSDFLFSSIQNFISHLLFLLNYLNEIGAVILG